MAFRRSPRLPRSLALLANFGGVLALAAAVVGLLGLLRLGRQFPAAAASPTLLVPFLFPVLALALETGALVALSTLQLRELLRSSAPLIQRARATLPLLGMLVLVQVGAELIPRGTEHPGAFANELVRTARASCGDSESVPVPLLGLSVSCGEPRRIEGPMPGVRAVHVAMRELTFSDDLRRVDIVGLELTAARALRVHLVAGVARIAGLAPWSRSPRLGPWQRVGILVALGCALWLAAGLVWSVAASGAEPLAPSTPAAKPRGRWLGWLLLAVPGAVVAAGFISLDQERAAPLTYASAALLGLVALGLLRLLVRFVPRIFRSFRAF